MAVVLSSTGETITNKAVVANNSTGRCPALNSYATRGETSSSACGGCDDLDSSAVTTESTASDNSSSR